MTVEEILRDNRFIFYDSVANTDECRYIHTKDDVGFLIHPDDMYISLVKSGIFKDSPDTLREIEESTSCRFGIYSDNTDFIIKGISSAESNGMRFAHENTSNCFSCSAKPYIIEYLINYFGGIDIERSIDILKKRSLYDFT